MNDVGLTGAVSVQRVGRALKEAGNGQLRRDLLKGIRESLKPVLPAIAQGAEDRLPRRGGLAARVASQKFATRTSLASGSVKITGSGMKALRDIDAGRVRHPAFGNRSVWVQQSVTPGFFTSPIETRLPAVRAAIEGVLNDVTKKLERP